MLLLNKMKTKYMDLCCPPSIAGHDDKAGKFIIPYDWDQNGSCLFTDGVRMLVGDKHIESGKLLNS